jgi:hypothetical protein
MVSVGIIGLTRPHATNYKDIVINPKTIFFGCSLP